MCISYIIDFYKNLYLNKCRYLVKVFAYQKVKHVTEATKRLREEYLHNYIMRNWITSKLQKLNAEQVRQLYGMVKEWTGEEADFTKTGAV